MIQTVMSVAVALCVVVIIVLETATAAAPAHAATTTTPPPPPTTPTPTTPKNILFLQQIQLGVLPIFGKTHHSEGRDNNRTQKGNRDAPMLTLDPQSLILNHETLTLNRAFTRTVAGQPITKPIYPKPYRTPNPLNTPIALPYRIPYITHLKEFRLWLI